MVKVMKFEVGSFEWKEATSFSTTNCNRAMTQ